MSAPLAVGADVAYASASEAFLLSALRARSSLLRRRDFDRNSFAVSFFQPSEVTILIGESLFFGKLVRRLKGFFLKV